jgi:DNA-binding transcriptional ArsR family regulator
MGRLYGKAGATQAAVDGARRRVLKFLEEQCGIPREVLRSTPQAIVEAVEERLGGSWSTLGEHLSQASETEHRAVTVASTLELVKALDRDQRDLAERMRFGVTGQTMWRGAN